MAKPKKGGARIKGQPAIYDEFKKNVIVALTPTGLVGLDSLASEFGLSRSELIERIGRRIIPLPNAETIEVSDQREAKAS